jgi:hypothetical protein
MENPKRESKLFSDFDPKLFSNDTLIPNDLGYITDLDRAA